MNKKSMKLSNEKIDRMHFVRLGYDSYSESYIAHQTDGANDWYYKISEELYYIFDKDRGKYLESRYQEDCVIINQLRVTVNTLACMYANLQETAGLL